MRKLLTKMILDVVSPILCAERDRISCLEDRYSKLYERHYNLLEFLGVEEHSCPEYVLKNKKASDE